MLGVRRNAETPTLDIGDEVVIPGDMTTRIHLFEALRTLGSTDRAIVVLRYWD